MDLGEGSFARPGALHWESANPVLAHRAMVNRPFGARVKLASFRNGTVSRGIGFVLQGKLKHAPLGAGTGFVSQGNGRTPTVSGRPHRVALCAQDTERHESYSFRKWRAARPASLFRFIKRWSWRAPAHPTLNPGDFNIASLIGCRMERVRRCVD